MIGKCAGSCGGERRADRARVVPQAEQQRPTHAPHPDGRRARTHTPTSAEVDGEAPRQQEEPRRQPEVCREPRQQAGSRPITCGVGERRTPAGRADGRAARQPAGAWKELSGAREGRIGARGRWCAETPRRCFRPRCRCRRERGAERHGGGGGTVSCGWWRAGVSRSAVAWPLTGNGDPVSCCW